MIGVIGPHDSVQLVSHVAGVHELGDQLVTRAYDHVDEAVAIARELGTLCDVILFTGRLPFQLAERAGGIAAEMSFVPYSGAELFRAIARAAIDHRGELPLASVDTIEPQIVADCFGELGLPVPPHIPLDGERDWAATVDDFIAFHEGALRETPDALAFTCLSEVHAALTAKGYRAARIEHSRIGIHEALRQATMAERLNRSRASQLAVGIVKIVDYPARAGTYERHATRLRVEQTLLSLAHKRGGRVTKADGDSFVVATNRGGVDAALVRSASGHASLLEPQIEGVRILSGFGVGDTYAEAETNAGQALRIAEGSGLATVVFADGEVRTAGAGADPLTLRETGALTKLSDELGIGPLSVQRLLGALRRVDTSSFSPQQLAEAYGVQPRSIRRILGRLVAAGYGTEVGIKAHAGAGRPQTLYSVEMQRLTNASIDEAR
ncbi:hypothetical protein [Agromyces soli]|uniref:Transcriptional regulator n=1 Tax=Agromyces soli TaxID=659012 RepID=A0ABY4B2A2_9MICO|nr:hypothetical protein [Agromyces soli]UOE27165.1 hypothetical protein MTP13_05110 [Agromyces soli]